MQIFTTFALFMWTGKIELKTVMQLEPVPEESEFFLQIPASFDVDQAGNFYVLDVEAKVVFRWDKSGNFVGVIGSPGQGPGEFSLSGRGGPQGFLQAIDETLYVLDGGKRQLMVFSSDGTFEKTLNILPMRSRVTGFYACKDGSFYVHQRRRTDDKLITEVIHISEKGDILDTPKSLEDDTFAVQGTTRQNRTFTWRAFNPALVTHYDRQVQALILAHSGSPKFDIVSASGTVTPVQLPLAQEDVTKEDREEFNQQPFLSGGRRRIKVEFPEKKPFFDHILPTAAGDYLVFSISPLYRKVRGIVLSGTGTLRGRFTYTCGENGTLLGSQGRILAVHMDEDDEFALDELIPSS